MPCLALGRLPGLSPQPRQYRFTLSQNVERAMASARAARRRLPALWRSAQAKTSRSISSNVRPAMRIASSGGALRGPAPGSGARRPASASRNGGGAGSSSASAAIRPSRAPGGQDRGAPDDVAQLADVARPVGRAQRRQRRRVELARPSSPASSRRKCAHQERDVAAPLAQRRQAQLEPRQPVVEIDAEGRAAGPRPRGRAASSPPRAPRTGELAGAADAPQPPGLQHAQQLRLQVERQLADLVEDQRAARRLLEPARAAAPAAPVKAPRSWPNSSLSASSRGSAPQLTATNGPPGFGPELVQRARQQLLARAALAGHQHRRRRRCHQRRPRQQPPAAPDRRRRSLSSAARRSFFACASCRRAPRRLRGSRRALTRRGRSTLRRGCRSPSSRSAPAASAGRWRRGRPRRPRARCGAAAAMTTAVSPTASEPTRWWMATRTPGHSRSISSAISASTCSAISM